MNSIKLALITLDVSYDAYYVVFVNGKLFDAGDDYHSKLKDKFEGIQEFLKFSNILYEVDELNFNTKDGDIYSDYDYIPKKNDSDESYLIRVNEFSEICK